MVVDIDPSIMVVVCGLSGMSFLLVKFKHCQIGPKHCVIVDVGSPSMIVVCDKICA